MEEPHRLPIREAADAIRAGELSSSDLTESVLARIEETEPALNAYITVTSEVAREQAAVADAELAAGRDRGPLHGIPFALKDLYDTAGVRTTGGSGFLRNRVPDEDAFVTKKLKEAGVVLTGKLNLHEFALGTTSINPHFGPVAQPLGPRPCARWEQRRQCGRDRGGVLPRHARKRLGRLDSDPRIALRRGRAHAHLRPGQPQRCPAALMDARPCRPTRENGRGRSAHSQRHRGLRSGRPGQR